MDAMGMECNKNQPNKNNPCSPMTVKIISRNRGKTLFCPHGVEISWQATKTNKKTNSYFSVEHFTPAHATPLGNNPGLNLRWLLNHQSLYPIDIQNPRNSW